MSRFHSYRVIFVAIVSVLVVFPVIASGPKVSLADAARGVVGQPHIPIENLADGTGGGGSTENCGPIDPGTPCYGGGGGSSTDCKSPHDYESCREACVCVYMKKKTACGTDTNCKYTAAVERERCFGDCYQQYH
jgi:hypothetical protein